MADSRKEKTMEVKLFKKESKYTDKDGVEKTATKFYNLCGDVLIPIEPTYFANKETGKDKGYAGRIAVLKAFAEEFKSEDAGHP